MRVDLPEKITSLSIYELFLPELTKNFIKAEENEEIIISFTKVESISSSAMPLILVIINSIYKQKNISLDLVYNPKLLYFLHHINFFYYVKKLGLANFNNEYIGGFGDYISQEYRKQHKMHAYHPIQQYYQLETMEERDCLRKQVYEDLVIYGVPKDYEEVLKDKNVLDETQVNLCIEIIAEIIANARLYSKSMCYSFLQTDKYNTTISVADSGIGFKNSLKLKKYPFKLKDIITDDKINDKKYEDFFMIMEVLKYSQDNQRRNLWELKKVINSRGGTLRIHSRFTQVTFTGNRCSKCANEDAIECTKCILKESQDSLRYSSLRIFSSGLKGVHIEIQL